VGSSEAGAAASRNVAEIMALAAATPARGHVRFTPRLARGLSYYTGAIMEITVAELSGSLGGGGRYDGLIGMFSGEEIPACGFSLGLERILVVMAEQNMFPSGVDASPADVLVTLFAGEEAEALALARELREGGARVEVYPEPDKLGKQFKYASSTGVPRVAVLGSAERERGVVAIKEMQTGEQSDVPRNELGAWLQERRAVGAREALGPRTES
jgi:histidyl-tRNA synthetase